MIDLVNEIEKIVRLHSVERHKASHRGAEASVIVLLQPERLLFCDFKEACNVVTDALIHLLPKVHMMGIKRVVEIKDPGLDMAKRAGLADGGGAHCTVWPAVMPRSGRSKARIRRPATAAIPAIMRKKIILSMP